MDCGLEKEAFKTLRKTQNTYSKLVDKAFDVGKKGLRKVPMSDKFLVPSNIQEQVADMIATFGAAKKQVYNAVDLLQKQLNSLSKEDGRALVRALNGDTEGKLPKEAMPTHLHAIYEKYRKVIDHNAQMLVSAGLLDKDVKIEHYLKRFYAKYEQDKSVFKKSYSEMLQSKVYKRQKLSLEQRVAIGMIEDPTFVISRTIADQKMQLMRANFLKTVSDMYAKDTKINDNFVYIPDEPNQTVKRYGALTGKYIPKEIKATLDQAHLLTQELSEIERYIFPIIDHIKVNVTVKNPVTHMYNLGSNIFVAGMDGSLTDVSKLMKMAVTDKKGFKALINEVSPFGFDSMLSQMEDMQLVKEKNGAVSVFKTIAKNVYLTQDSKGGKAIRKLYDWEDKIFKLGAYVKAKKVYKQKLKRDLTFEELRIVYKEAIAPYADYSTPLPAALRWVDKLGVFPFVHYVYKSTPAVAKLILKHPFRYMAFQAALVASGASIFRDKDDKLKPEWAGNKLNAALSKEWIPVPFAGGEWYLNMGRLVPGIKFGEMMIDGGFVGSTFKITSGVSPLGYAIGSKYDTYADKLRDRFMALLENYAPPLTLGRYAQRGVNIALGRGQKNYYNEPMSVKEYLLRMVGVRKFNRAKEASKNLKFAKDKYNNSVKKDPNNKLKYKKEYDEMAKEVQAQARKHGVRPAAKKRVIMLKNLKIPNFTKNLIKF